MQGVCSFSSVEPPERLLGQYGRFCGAGVHQCTVQPVTFPRRWASASAQLRARREKPAAAPVMPCFEGAALDFEKKIVVQGFFMNPAENRNEVRPKWARP